MVHKPTSEALDSTHTVSQWEWCACMFLRHHHMQFPKMESRSLYSVEEHGFPLFFPLHSHPNPLQNWSGGGGGGHSRFFWKLWGGGQQNDHLLLTQEFFRSHWPGVIKCKDMPSNCPACPCINRNTCLLTQANLEAMEVGQGLCFACYLPAGSQLHSRATWDVGAIALSNSSSNSSSFSCTLQKKESWKVFARQMKLFYPPQDIWAKPLFFFRQESYMTTNQVFLVSSNRAAG